MKKSTSTNQGNQDGGDRRRSGTPSVGAEERETGEPASTDRTAAGDSGEDDSGRGGASAGGGVNPSERVASGGERTGDGRVSGGAEGGKRVAV